MAFGSGGVAPHLGAHRGQLCGKCKGLLLGAIVQFACQAVALFGDGQRLKTLLGDAQLIQQLFVLTAGQFHLAQCIAISGYENVRSQVKEQVDRLNTAIA